MGMEPAEKDLAVTSAKVRTRVLADAKLAAVYRGMTLIDYVSTVLRAAVDRDIEDGHARHEQAKARH